MNGESVFSAFREEDSKHFLAIKDNEISAIMGHPTTATSITDLSRDFSKRNRGQQEFVAYNLSHEWKIATLAAAIPIANQNSNVFEIGSSFGLSSIHYSHLVKSRDLTPGTPVSRLIAVEKQRAFLKNAKQLQKICREYAGEIKYVSDDGIAYLRKALQNGDLVFSSLATSSVIEGILELSRKRSFSFVVSYSQSNRDIVRRHCGKHFEDIIDSSKYDIFPFDDKEYHTHVIDDVRRMGVLAQMIRR